MDFRVAFVGNFGAPFSTECDLAWTFTELGWQVIRLQENVATTDDWLRSGLSSDLFVWVHTHGWEPRNSITGILPAEVIHHLRDHCIPTIAIHQDRYFGLEINDHRESQIGVHDWWKMDYIFTSDGGNQDRFRERNVNHHWLPSGICYKHCWLGKYREDLACDVAFIGSREYHPEYPFRTQMVDWLDQRHPWTVKRWGGDRPGAREDLNDIMASAKIIVGDSCFAGSPYYFSDRVVEVMGRGGFLLHPASLGMDVTGMANYAPQDLNDLEKCIEYYLDPAQDSVRNELRMLGYENTKQFHTWHNRLILVLNMLGLN